MQTKFPVYPVALTAAFVALDIAGKIDWSVWWLVSPMLIALAVAIFVAIATGAGKAGK